MAKILRECMHCKAIEVYDDSSKKPVWINSQHPDYNQLKGPYEASGNITHALSCPDDEKTHFDELSVAIESRREFVAKHILGKSDQLFESARSLGDERRKKWGFG